jgi:hypothetical protein
MIHEPSHRIDRAPVARVLLEVAVDRSPLDTFDLWTRFEALPRLRRHGLVGDADAVRAVERTGDADPTQFTPSALTVVDGPDGYTGIVWIRDAAPASGSSSRVVLGIDDPSATVDAARDLARFVEFVLVEGLDRELEAVLPCACRGITGTGASRHAPMTGDICGLPTPRRGHRDG